jgi:L-serine deaminase
MMMLPKNIEINTFSVLSNNDQAEVAFQIDVAHAAGLSDCITEEVITAKSVIDMAARTLIVQLPNHRQLKMVIPRNVKPSQWEILSQRMKECGLLIMIGFPVVGLIEVEVR